MSEKVIVNENENIPAENTELVVAENPPSEDITVESLIVVKQLPVIEEQLKSIKAVIEKKVANVLALDCNEKTVNAIKVLRTDLRKDFEELEQRRKLVKNKVMEPYEAFDKVYKECVTNIFEDADGKLKKRIDEVDNARKAEKRAETEAYFNEYLQSKNIDFVTFEDAKINVTLNASKKSLLEAAKAFIDRICDDLKLIDTQEHKEEILVEYKKSLNVSSAITSVSERHKAIEAERERQQEAQAIKETEQATVDKVNAAKAETAPLTAPKTAPKTASDEDKVIIMTVGKVKAKKSDLLILKQLLTNGKYEIIK